MKTKYPKKAHGAYVATAVKQLRRSGLNGDALEIAINALTVGNKRASIRIPREVSRTICDRLANTDRIVIVNKSPKKWKVFSLEAYLSMSDAGVKIAKHHKPWEHAAKKRNSVTA